MSAASVEMISNAIAEMRTYGEGFVIADQSPAGMDQSVMRNTFTKVFFNLPEREDRAVAASSLELEAAQQAELSKIDTGVAVVYHREWAEPVLTKIRYFSEAHMQPYCHPARDIWEENRALLGQALAVLLHKRMCDSAKASSYDEALIKELLAKEYSWLGDREFALKDVLNQRMELLQHKSPAGEICAIYALFADIELQVKQYSKEPNLEKRVQYMLSEITRIAALGEEEAQELIGLMMIHLKAKSAEVLKLYGEYKTMLASK